tara:strand:+ start:2893 stop:3168 length:276 start_codon:yes stop_codon:yes gene_type:complete
MKIITRKQRKQYAVDEGQAMFTSIQQKVDELKHEMYTLKVHAENCNERDLIDNYGAMIIINSLNDVEEALTDLEEEMPSIDMAIEEMLEDE